MKLSEVGVTVKVDAAAWVTEMVCVIPPPVTVILAFRSEVNVLAVALTFIVAPPEPESGETVNQVASPLLTVQLVLEVMSNVFCSPPTAKLSEAGDTVNMAASWVTLIVCAVTPGSLLPTDRVAVLCAPEALAPAVTFTVASLEPEGGETVIHEASPLPTVQLMFEVIENGFCSPE